MHHINVGSINYRKVRHMSLPQDSPIDMCLSRFSSISVYIGLDASESLAILTLFSVSVFLEWGPLILSIEVGIDNLACHGPSLLSTAEFLIRVVVLGCLGKIP